MNKYRQTKEMQANSINVYFGCYYKLQILYMILKKSQLAYTYDSCSAKVIFKVAN